MALFKIFKGSQDNLGTVASNTNAAHEGYAYFTTDNGKFYIDIADAATAQIGVNRIPLSADKADKDVLGHAIEQTYVADVDIVNGTVGLYGGDGSLIKTIQIPTSLQEKTFTNVIGTANNNANAAFYFGKILPTSYYDTWRIEYRVSSITAGRNDARSYHHVIITGTQGNLISYANFNTIANTSYRSIYYHELYRAKEAGITNNYGHLLGVGLHNAWNPTTAANSRTITVEIDRCVNCTFAFFDNVIKYANAPGTGSTNYNAVSELDAYTNGLRETSDDNTITQNRIGYTSSVAAETIYRYQMLLRTKDRKLLPVSSANNVISTTERTYTTTPFDPFSEIYYYNSTTTINANGNVGNDTLYRQILADLRYSFGVNNTATYKLVARQPVYLTATLQNDGTAILTVPSGNENIGPLVQTLPSEEDGLIYIYLGQAYEDTNPYRLELTMNSHPIYIYKNGQIRQYSQYAGGVHWSNVLDKPSTFTPSSHSHGNITNAGELSTETRAVVTDANKKITVADLTVSDSTADNGLQYVYKVTQNATGKITVSKSNIREASASQSGIVSTGAQAFAGDKTFTGNVTLSGETDADSLTAGNLIVTGNTSVGDITVDNITGRNLTASQAVVTDANKKITTANLTVSSATAESTTATTFVHSVTQDAQGKITVKTRPLPTYNNYSLPLAASGTRGGIQIGYSESGNNYAVKLSSEKAYVTVPWTDTKVTAVDNHYTPAADTNAALSASASGASAAWSIDVVKAVQLQRDAKGHVTGVTVTSGKIPANPNTDYRVRQTNDASTNANYRLLLSNSANDTQEDQISRKNANLIYNPFINKLSTGNLDLTGILNVTGNAYLHNQTAADSLTAGSLLVTGNANFTQSPTAPTPADGDSSTQVATTAFIKWGNVAGKPSSFTPSSHSHGNITNAGELSTANRVVITDGNKKITISSVTSTELGYLSGVTSAIQTQVNAKAPLASPALTGTPTAPTAAAGTNTTQIATTAFVTNAVAQGFVANDAMVFKGLIGSNQTITQLPTSGYNAGWTYRVADAGTFAGEYCEVGDLLIAINDGPASGSSVINTDWGKVEHNIDGAVFRGSGASNSSVGSSTQPVYVNASGIVTAITGAIANDTTGNATTATTASKLSNTSKIGDTNKPVYFTAGGIPAAISYTINKSVPSNAVFTDTTYTFANGTDGSFSVTPSGGSTQTVSIGKPATAGTADAVAWSGITGKPSTTLATDTGTSSITLAHGGKYKLTAGGTSVIFTMPTDNNTTYTFTDGTNGFTVTPSGGTAQTVTVTPSVSKSDVGLGNVTNHQQVHEVTWDATNKKITRSKNGTAGDVVQFVAGSNVTLTAEAGKLTIASSYTNSRDPGYGKITPAGDTGTSAVTANTTQITAGTYNEAFTFKTGNKWLTIAGTNSSTNGSDVLTIGHKAGLTAKSSYGSTATTASADGGTIKVTDVQYDEAGHITASTDRTITLSQVKNTAGSTDTSSKIYLIGATSQAANPQTYSDNEVFVTDGTLSTKNISVSGTATLSGETEADSLTVGNLQVNGSANFVNSPTAPTPTAASNDTSVATTAYVTSAINALDGTISGSPGAGKTLTAFSQTDGKVSATFGNISITKSQVSDFSHTHGNISNAGAITATQTIANGDKIVIVDSSDSSKLTGATITFDGSTATKALTQKGTWETFNNYSHPTATAYSSGLYKITVNNLGHVTAATAVTASDITGLNIYWANVKTTSAATYKAQPEVASVKINGKTTSGDADSASTKNVQLVYDASLEVLNFVFS